MITTSAPGKVFLLGEYAVLEGYGALVGAVDKRVVVQFEPDGGNVLRVQGTVLQAELQANTLLDALQGPASRVAAGVLASGRFLGGTLTIDSSALFEGSRKLGYGSSAAVVVAVAAALGRADFSAAKRWHNRAQKAEGSGGDIAASLLGRVAWLEKDVATPVSTRPPLAILQHPEAASTPKLVGAAKAFALREPSAYAMHMHTLGALASNARNALLADDTAGFVAVVRQANQALDRFGAAAEMPIVTDYHRRACAVVESLGGACKPAGAGGGDISLITAADENALEHIIDALKPHATRCLLAESGVTIQSS